MSWIAGTRARLRLLFGRRAAETRMEEEFRFHIEMETERVARELGLEPAAARRQALITFGGVDRHREGMREGRGLGSLSGISLDVKLGLRMLAKYPGVTIAAGLALAISVALAAGWFEFLNDMASPRPAVVDAKRFVLVQ